MILSSDLINYERELERVNTELDHQRETIASIQAHVNVFFSLT